jgi:hypothetical protein
MIRAIHTAAALTLVAGTLWFTSTSRADDATVATPSAAAVVVVQPAPATETVRTTESSGPDMSMLGAGIVTFGISYGVGVAVAATSAHQGDSHLYVPIVGPWLDFADRGNCPQTSSCGGETVNRVLIVVDGVFQGIGVLSVVSSLIFTKTTTTTTNATTEPSVQLTPVRYANGGLGLAAVGRF